MIDWRKRKWSMTHIITHDKLIPNPPIFFYRLENFQIIRLEYSSDPKISVDQIIRNTCISISYFSWYLTESQIFILSIVYWVTLVNFQIKLKIISSTHIFRDGNWYNILGISLLLLLPRNLRGPKLCSEWKVLKFIQYKMAKNYGNFPSVHQRA